MCTVTYIPQGNNEFILTSNRDENISRATSKLETYSIGREEVLLPVDPVSKGSWIAVSSSQRVSCILNGAFHKHHHEPPYARSRGLVLLDYFEWPGFSDFLDHYSFEGIEPFTMIVCEPDQLVEFRWDGEKTFAKNLNLDAAHIWSSTTLYDERARALRESWFWEWLRENPEPAIEDQLHFHRHGGPEDHVNGLIMNRENKVQTVSITGIDKKSSFASLKHQDLVQNRSVNGRVSFLINRLMD
jgi:hypothetical protein